MTITNDLRKFGSRELRMAAELLLAYCDEPPEFLTDGLCVMVNFDSGNVFLTDEDLNVAMMNGGKLEQWHFCPECGEEGFAEDMPDKDCCQAYLREMRS